MVKFLIDESTGSKLGQLLIRDGHDVVFVKDWHLGAKDHEVIEKANNESRIIITDDKDFGELVFRFGKKSKGIILIRMHSYDPKARLAVLRNVIKKVDLAGKFVVIKDKAIKVVKIR